MIENGGVKLLEHNVRFGDPECQCLMVRLQSDLVDLLYKAAVGKLEAGPEHLSTLAPTLAPTLALNLRFPFGRVLSMKPPPTHPETSPNSSHKKCSS